MDRPLIVLDRSSLACVVPCGNTVDELQSPAPAHDRSTVFCPVAVEQGVEYPDVVVAAAETAAVVAGGGIVDKDTVFGARVPIIVNTATLAGGVGIHDLYGVQGQGFVRIDRTAVAGDFAALKDHILERGRCCDVENTEIAGGQRGIQYRFPVGHRNLDGHHTVVKGAAHQAAVDGDGGGDGDLTEEVAFCVFCIQRDGLIRCAPIHILGEGDGAAAVGIGKGDRFPQRCLEVVRTDHVFQRIHHQTGVFPEQRGGTFYIIGSAVDVFGTRRTVDVLVDDRGSAGVFRAAHIVPVAVRILIQGLDPVCRPCGVDAVQHIVFGCHHHHTLAVRIEGGCFRAENGLLQICDRHITGGQRLGKGAVGLFRDGPDLSDGAAVFVRDRCLNGGFVEHITCGKAFMLHHTDGGGDGVDVVFIVVSILCERNVIVRRSGFVAEDDAVCDQHVVSCTCIIMNTTARHSGRVARNGGVHNIDAVTVSAGDNIHGTAAFYRRIAEEGGVDNIGVVATWRIEEDCTAVTGAAE